MRTITFNDWYKNDSGNIMSRHAKSWLTGAVSTLTCEWRVKNHITKKAYSGHTGNVRAACKRANEKMLREIIAMRVVGLAE